MLDRTKAASLRLIRNRMTCESYLRGMRACCTDRACGLGGLMMGMRMPWQQGDYIQTFICGFIYFLLHLHAQRASVDVPARPVFCSHLRGSGFKPNSVVFDAQQVA